MRLLHVASSYPLTDNDGTAPFMAEMLEALAARGHEMSVVLPKVDGLVDGNRRGVSVVTAPYAPRSLQAWGYGKSIGKGGRPKIGAVAIAPIALAAMARTMRTAIAETAPDVVHLHWVLPQGALAVAISRQMPIVVSAHGIDARLTSGSLRWAGTRVLQRADALVAASTSMLNAVDPAGVVPEERRHVIPHGADTSLFGKPDREKSRQNLGVPTDRRVILSVGRLVAKKGFDTLIASMSHDPSHDLHLYIVGEGPDRLSLETRAAHDSRIHLVGSQTRDQVADWYAAADLVVIPGSTSRRDVDSGPVVLVEALAAGRSIVTTPVGMAPDVIEDGINGILVDTPTPEKLADGIAKGLTQQRVLEPAARTAFQRLGGWDRVARQLEVVYEEAISRRSASDG